MIDVAEVNAAMQRLRSVAECCDYTTTAVHFYAEHKDGLADDIRTVLEHMDEITALLANRSSEVQAHLTINIELHHRITEAVAEGLQWRARCNELEQQLAHTAHN
jgi:hypothetical protein